MRFFLWEGGGGGSENKSLIQNHLDHGASKDPKNPFPEWIHRFLWCPVIQMILNQCHVANRAQNKTNKQTNSKHWNRTCSSEMRNFLKWPEVSPAMSFSKSRLNTSDDWQKRRYMNKLFACTFSSFNIPPPDASFFYGRKKRNDTKSVQKLNESIY